MAQPFVSVKGRGAVGGMLGGQNKIRERVKLNSSVFLLLFTTVNNANRHTLALCSHVHTVTHSEANSNEGEGEGAQAVDN